MALAVVRRARGKLREAAEFLWGPVYSELTKPILLARYLLRKLATTQNSGISHDKQGLARCAVRYMNLPKRIDRDKEMLGELRKMRIDQFSRYEAIETNPGILGCTSTHASLLSDPIGDYELLMICEDDAKFLVDREYLDSVIEGFFHDPRLDVLCLSFFLRNKPISVGENFAISNNIQTAACYVVRKSKIGLLKESFDRAADKLAKDLPVWVFAGDIAWKSLQRWRLVFAVPRETLVIQRPSFSDIQGESVDYWKQQGI